MARKRTKKSNIGWQDCSSHPQARGAMQPIPAQPWAMIPPQLAPRATTMDNFTRHRPVKFNGKATLDDADLGSEIARKFFRWLTTLMHRNSPMPSSYWLEM